MSPFFSPPPTPIPAVLSPCRRANPQETNRIKNTTIHDKFFSGGPASGRPDNRRGRCLAPTSLPPAATGRYTLPGPGRPAGTYLILAVRTAANGRSPESVTANAACRPIFLTKSCHVCHFFRQSSRQTANFGVPFRLARGLMK